LEKYLLMSGKLVSAFGEAIAARRMRKTQEKELKNLKESTFIAPGLLQAEALAQKNANATRYAGQDQDEANIRQGAATAFDNVSRSTTSSANLVNAAMGIQANQNKAMQNVAQTGQQIRQQNMGGWTNLLLQKAGQQSANRKQFEATSSALRGAIMQNRARQTNALWNGAAAVADDINGFFKSMYGGGLTSMLGGGGGGLTSMLGGGGGGKKSMTGSGEGMNLW
jgi:hypothetical protein